MMAKAKQDPIDIQKHLKGVDYPVDKQSLPDHAKSRGADASVMSALERLPDRDFESPAEVNKAIGDL